MAELKLVIQKLFNHETLTDRLKYRFNKGLPPGYSQLLFGPKALRVVRFATFPEIIQHDRSQVTPQQRDLGLERRLLSPCS